jgi:hypothetical protein
MCLQRILKALAMMHALSIAKDFKEMNSYKLSLIYISKTNFLLKLYHVG